MATDVIKYKVEIRYTLWYWYLVTGLKLMQFTGSKRMCEHFANIAKTKTLVKLK